MARQNLMPIVRRLRPSPERFAAAAAVYDPALLLNVALLRITTR